MTKKVLNQNGKYVQELINTIEPDFIFNKNSIDRFKVVEINDEKIEKNKDKLLSDLRKQLAKREVDEEAGKIAPKTFMEREEQNRRM